MLRALALLVALVVTPWAEAQTLSTLTIPPESVRGSELSPAEVDSLASLETRIEIARSRAQGPVADSLQTVLQALLPPAVLPYARVFADGNARSGVTGSPGSGSTTGSLGAQVQTHLLGTRADAAFRISVFGAADSVLTDYGHALLAPATGSTLDAGIADVRSLDVLGNGQVVAGIGIETALIKGVLATL